MAAMTNATVLIVADDDPADGQGLAYLEERLQAWGHAVCAAVSLGRCAISATERAIEGAPTRPDLALIDLGRDGSGADGSGIEVAEWLAVRSDIPSVHLTDGADGSLLRRARLTGPAGYVLKPFDERQLRLTIEAALAMRQRVQLLESILNSLGEGVAVTDSEGCFLFVNPAAEQIVGMGATDAGPDRWAGHYGVYHADGVTPFPADRLPLTLAMRGVAVDDVELFIRNRERPDGVFISTNARPLSAGGQHGGIVVFRDVTMLKRTEHELRRTIDDLEGQSQLLETVFHSISDGVVVADCQGTIKFINRSAMRIVGVDIRDVDPAQWSQWREVYDVFERDRVTPVPVEETALSRAVRGETSDEAVFFIRNRQEDTDGMFISVRGTPLLGPREADRGGVVVFRDVTERVRTEEALTRAFAQGRVEVLDTLLHNIGNAITSVATGVGTLREQLLDNDLVRRLSAVADALAAHRDDWTTYLENDPQGRQVLPFILAVAEDFAGQNERLQRVVERVSGRVAHIVDVIRTQRAFDYENMARKEIDLRKAIADAVGMLDDLLTEHGIETRIDCRHAPRTIRIQESRFHQMLVNLLKNAIEAIDSLAAPGELQAQGRIRVSARIQKEVLVIDVTDNGIGIEPDRLQSIFSAGFTTKAGGSGLGLHSAASFVIDAGGNMRALSDGIGTGTTIRSTFPRGSYAVRGSVDRDRRSIHDMTRERGPTGAVIGKEDQGNRRVLIVDDQQDIHDDFTEMLEHRAAAASDEISAAFVAEQRGERTFPPTFELLHATSGEDAYAIVKQGAAEHRPVAVAFVDIRMPPGMDGVETVRRIRTIDSHIEVVMMTAYTDTPLPEIVQDMTLLHKLLYIRKPFAREEVQQIAVSLVEKWNVERELAARQRQLVSSHRRLETVLNATGDAIAMYGVNRRLLFANRSYEEMVGVSSAEMQRMSPEAVDAHVRDRFREPQLADAECRFLIADAADVVETVRAKAGAKRCLYYRSHTVVRDDRGDAIGDLYVYRDISREIEAERMKAEVTRLRHELETNYSFDGMVGSGARMRQVYALMKHAAEGDITVLVRGESGTGKELVARSLHFSSARRRGPFLAVDCAAVPEALIESELFGHEAGAFTGAVRRRIGTFERAAGGTVLLDEIGDMSPVLQAKLLRVLQEREIRRVGGSTVIAIDVRVIAATNKDLEAAVRAGEFREDLFYRIAAFPIVVPPLRERREDIPLLAKHLLHKHADRMAKPMSGISDGALRLLQRYGWPGNVREMENAIARAVLLETTDVLQVESLPPQLSASTAEGGDHALPADAVLPLAVVERQALVRALEASAGNVTLAARALSIDRATLYRKLKRYDLLAKA